MCLSKLRTTTPHGNIHVTSKSPVGDISVVTLIRTDTTLDHSQKAEKVCILLAYRQQGLVDLSSAENESHSVLKTKIFETDRKQMCNCKIARGRGGRSLGLLLSVGGRSSRKN